MHHLGILVSLVICILFPFCRSEERRCGSNESFILDSMRELNYNSQFRALVFKLTQKSKIQHCFAIIADRFHDEIWVKSFFVERLHPVSYFIVRIDYAEDTLNPDYKTVRVLNEIKRKNCDLIMIFLVNGIQTKRLLVFLDENRVLNTRSKFVLLYDHRIISKDIHYIWRRILSVIFLRVLENQRQFQAPCKIGFELITVPFPKNMKGSFAGKSLGVWFNERLTEKGELFNDKASNLEALELKVAAYEHIPMVVKQYNTQNKFSGVEVEIVEAISDVMNFTAQYYQSSDSISEKWGRHLLNGSYTGLLGEMANRQADIAIADLHLNMYHLGLMDLSIPHSSECLTFLTPESITDKSWKTFVLPLRILTDSFYLHETLCDQIQILFKFNSGQMWTGVLVSLFFVGTVFYAISLVHRSIIYDIPFKNPFRLLKVHRNQKSNYRNINKWVNNINNQRQELIQYKDIFDKFSDCLLLTYSMLLQIALPRVPKHWPLRILTGWYWTYCIQVAVIYRASLTAILANPSQRITIDTLSELADSSLVIAAWGEQNREFFNSAFDETAQKIAVNLELIDDPDKSVAQIASGKYAYYDNEYYLRHLRLQRTNNLKDGAEEVLHIMKECVLHVPVSIGLEKNSPLKPNVDKYLRRLIEGGLVEKWLKDTTKDLIAEEQTPPEALMDLAKFWSSLAVLGIGYLVSILALIGECLHFEYIVKRHPMYDRYNPRAYYQFIKK